MRHMSMRSRAAVACSLLVLVVSCSSHKPAPPASGSRKSSSPPASASASATAFRALQTCTHSVPGAQHAVAVTVGQVRKQGIGLGGPRPPVRNFSPSDSPSAPAAYCYRWVPARHLDEWWGVSASGTAVKIAALSGVTRDVGTFDGAGFR